MTFARFAVCLGIFTATAFAQEVAFEQTSKTIPSTAPHNDRQIGISSYIADAIVEESQAWDNFTLSDDITLSGLTWKGAYNNTFFTDGPRGQTDFLIEFYPSTNNRPDLANPLHSFTLDGGLAGMDDSTEISETVLLNEVHSSGGAIVEYSTSVPQFDLAAGDYWLTIQAQQTLPNPLPVLDPEWSWVLSNDTPTGIYSYDEAEGDRVEPGIFIRSVNTTFSILAVEEVMQGILGDFDSSEVLDAADVDLLAAAIRAGDNDQAFDLTGDGVVDDLDHDFWLSDVSGYLPGDANFDKEVGFLDFLRLSTNFGKEGGWAEGNFNTDTEVGFVDFLILSTNFGRFSESEVAVSSVPEPTGISLLMIALVSVAGVRRRRRVAA